MRGITIEDLFRIESVGRVAMAPDGRRVVFELARQDLKKNANYVRLMIADVATGTLRPLTHGDHRDQRPEFSPDGSRLGFLSDRDGTSAVWIMPMDGGEPFRLTDCDGHVRDFAFSPNGKRVAYAYARLNERQQLLKSDEKKEDARRPQYKHITRLIHKMDGAGYWNGEYSHIHVISAAGGRSRCLTTGSFDHNAPRFSPDGREIAFTSNRADDPDYHWDQMAVYAVPARGGRIRRITQGHGMFDFFAWSPDGSSIACIGLANKPRGWFDVDRKVFLVPASGGRPRELTRGCDLHCSNTTGGDVASVLFNVAAPLWSGDSQRVTFMVTETGATRLYSIDVRGRDLRCEVGGDRVVLDMHQACAGGPVALAMGSATNPSDLYVMEDHGEPRRLTEVNRRLFARRHIAEPERFTVRSGSVTVEGWLLKPPGFRANRRYPAILEVHGGPETQYGYSFFHEMQWLAARGFIVAYANPRGSTGYGYDHMRAIKRDWGNLDAKDVSAVGRWLKKRPWVDAKRVGITGGSYGGFMTNWLIAKSNEFAAAVTQRSCVNLESMAGTSDYGSIMGDEFGGAPWTNPDGLRRQSPLTYVKRVRTPTLIIHSEEDLRCPVEQADQYFMALKMIGCEVEYVRFEGESHGLSRDGRPQNRAERLRRIGGWMEAKLK